MLAIKKLSNEEILSYIGDDSSKNIDEFDLIDISKEIYSRGLYKNIIFDKLTPKVIKSLVKAYCRDYLDYLNDNDINLFLEKLISYLLDKYIKLVSLDSIFSDYVIKAIIFLNISIDRKINFVVKLSGKKFPGEFVDYLIENVEDWNQILDYLRNLGEVYIISLFDNYRFNLPDNKLALLKDEYIFLYSIVRGEKLFSKDKNKSFIKFLLDNFDNLKYKKPIDLVFKWGIEIDDDIILGIIKLFLDGGDGFYSGDEILDSVNINVLAKNIDGIADLLVEYLQKPESVNIDKGKIKRFLNKLFKLLLQNIKYNSVIRLILKLYDSNVNFDKKDLILLEDRLVINLLASLEISNLPVYEFEKIIYFMLYFDLIDCYKLSNLKFKKFYNRFVVYRFLKTAYKKKMDCHFGYDFLGSLRHNYWPFSTSIVFYFLYWLYLKLVKKKT